MKFTAIDTWVSRIVNSDHCTENRIYCLSITLTEEQYMSDEELHSSLVCIGKLPTEQTTS